MQRCIDLTSLRLQLEILPDVIVTVIKYGDFYINIFELLNPNVFQ